MKSKILIITIISLTFIIVGSLLFTSSCNTKQVGVKNVLGNDYTNLLAGGRVAKQGDVVYYISSSINGLLNNISTYDLRTKKTKSLKSFVAIPTELCVSDDYIFFKKGVTYVAELPLYRMNTNGKKCEKIISKSIREFNIYFNKIYYTVESPTDFEDVGLFQCDIDGKNQKRIICTEVDDFVVFEDDIYYIKNNSIRHYNLIDGTDVEIKCYPNCSLYHLTINKEDLFYVKTDDIDYDKESLIRFNLNDNSETVLYDGKCGLIHSIDDIVIFCGEDEYYVLNLSNNTLYSFAETYNIKEDKNITELYIFDSQCFFFVNAGNTERLIYKNFNSNELVDINK